MNTNNYYTVTIFKRQLDISSIIIIIIINSRINSHICVEYNNNDY